MTAVFIYALVVYLCRHLEVLPNVVLDLYYRNNPSITQSEIKRVTLIVETLLFRVRSDV